MQSTTLSTKLFYGFGSVAYGVKDNGFSFFLLLFYNQVLGLSAESAGVAISVALVFDAISDPIIGHLSDHCHSRLGRRHPFMYASAFPVAISYYFLWSPPAGLSEDQLFYYLLLLAVLVRTFITVYEIPSSSLVAELTNDYDERTSMLGFRYFFGWTGGITIAALAYTFFLQPNETYANGVLNPEGYKSYGLVASSLMAIAILVSAAGTHQHIPRLKSPPPKKPFHPGRTLREFVETLSNRPFLALFFSGMFLSMATGVVSSLDLYFNTYFWELSSDQISYIVSGYFFAAAIGPVLANRLSARWGKKAAGISIFMVSILLFPAPLSLRLMGLFPENGSPLLVPLLIAISTTCISLLIGASILFSSMVADAVEDSELSTGRRSEGIFFAARSFVTKMVSGAGVIAATTMLSIVGFPEDATPGEVDPTILIDLAQLYIPTLLGFFALSIGCLLFYRISREQHAANIAKLAES